MRNFIAMPGFLRLLMLLGVSGMPLMLLAAATMGVEVQGQVIDARSWRSSGGAWVALFPFVFTTWSSILMLARRAYGRWIYLVAMSSSNMVIPLAIGMAGVVVPEATMRLAMGVSAVMAVVLGGYLFFAPSVRAYFGNAPADMLEGKVGDGRGLSRSSRKKIIVSVVALPLMIMFWVGSFWNFTHSASWAEARQLLLQNSAYPIASNGEVDPEPWNYSFRRSNDSESFKINVHVREGASERRFHAEFERVGGTLRMTTMLPVD